MFDKHLKQIFIAIAMNNTIHGSFWWKCDFHNHTPASSDYGRNPEEKENMTEREWLLGYMRAEIDCVGITDHNTGGGIDRLQSELIKMEKEQPQDADYRPLCLFPGVEISVSAGIHILALFDPSKKSQDVISLLGAVGMPIDGYGNSKRVTNASVAQVIDSIVSAGGIAIPAHVDKDKGLFEVWKNTVSTKEVLDLHQLLAVEVVDNAYVMPPVYQQAKLRLANIAGSDSHSPDIINSAFTWVKMQEPNIEALKLALHDGEDGAIRYSGIEVDPNNIENRFFISSLKVSGGMKAGNRTPLSINFSPWMTSIIGGRGSGKSSLFNFIRIPFGKDDGMPGPVKEEYDKFNKFGPKEGMLRQSTVIEVEFFKEGRHLKLEYTAQDNSRKLLEKTSGDWETISDEINPSRHYGIDVFSQKQLYALANEPSQLLSMIDRKFDKVQWKEKLAELEAAWMATRQRERELTRELKNEADVKESLNAIEARIKSYEGKEKDLLLEFKDCNSTKEVLKGSVADFDVIMSQILDITDTFSSYDLVPDGSVSNLGEVSNLIVLDERIKEEFSKITASYVALETIKNTINAEIRASAWYARQIEVSGRYQQLINELRESGQETNVDYEELLMQRKALDEKLTKINSVKEELVAITSAQTELRAEIYAHQKDLRTKRKEALDNWESVGEDRTILVAIDELRDYTSAENTFRELISKVGSDFGNEILRRSETVNGIEEPSDGLLHDIISLKDVNDRWAKLSQRIHSFVEATETSPNGFNLKFVKYKEKLKLTTPEMLDRLLIWVPEDKVVLKLLRNGRKENIDTGSAGQKTAGMLSLLLTSDSGPLLIDQPEDDLDTRLIGELLVANFKLLKKKRQIIVITHNPNIAVNGSSEKVVQMEFIKGQIVKQTSGALQDKKVRVAVCEIMEGGRDALDKRYYRISQALGTMG